MAVRLETSRKHFLADEESDDLPSVGRVFDGAVLAGTDLPVGSTVLYRLSGKIRRWDGREWCAVEQHESQEYLLAAVLFELRRLNQRIELLTA